MMSLCLYSHVIAAVDHISFLRVGFTGPTVLFEGDSLECD